MTDPAVRERPHVAICGADHAALALNLARAGCPVILFEPDPHDRVRLSDMLSRLGSDAQITVTGDPEVTAHCDLALTGASGPALPGELPVLSLDWGGPAMTALQLSRLPGRRPLLECIGPDRRGLVVALGDVLGAQLIRLPRHAVPPSQRLMAVLSAEIEALALTGATPEEVDEALEGAGFAPGPFELQDILGIDTCLAARRAVLARHPGAPELPLFARAVAEGRLGRKVGVGWYRYPGGGGKVEDPLIEDMAIEEARFAGLSRTDVGAETICGRLVAVLHAEAGRIAADAPLSVSKVDDVAQLAIGSPPRLLG